MRRGLKGVFSTAPFVELCDDDFEKIASACGKMENVLYLEEKFAFLIENHRELEIEALKNTVMKCAWSPKEWSDWVSDTHLFNRRIVNLLTTTRLYTDQTPQHLACVFGKASTEVKMFNDLLSAKYDSSFAYRLLDAIRNYSQHAGLPLHGLYRYEKVLDKKQRDSTWFHCIGFMLETKKVLADAKFKKSVAMEIEQEAKDRIDLRPLILEYVGLLAETHEEIRKHISPHVEVWSGVIQKAIDDYGHPPASYGLGLALVEQESEGRFVSKHHLNAEVGKRYLGLVSTYSDLSSLTKRIITSQSLVK